jgi:pimeloyl-ACP methyl ester carboxylesterase
MNPGGPGASGIARLDAIAAALPNEVRDRFDVVSFDPRGTGATLPIDCVDSLDPLFDASFSPTDERQRAALVSATEAVTAACAQRNGVRLSQVSTLDTARDLDALRAALGEANLNYLGFSYGTYLGAVYAALFPDRVRALVLDGAVDPTLDATQSTLLQARGFEQSLDSFLRSCARDPDCRFHRGGHSAREYDALRRRITRAPLRASQSGGRTLNVTRFDAAVLEVLYGGRSSWGEIADALDAADRGDGAALLAIADEFVGREAGGRDDDSVEAFWAISCLDGPAFGDTEAMHALDDEARGVAPRLGAFIVNFSLACSEWPVAPIATPPSIAGVAPTAMVVGTSGDPATPLVSARNLARTLGGASLVTARGSRHTALASGNACVDAAVTAYLDAPRSARSVTHC